MFFPLLRLRALLSKGWKQAASPSLGSATRGLDSLSSASPRSSPSPVWRRHRASPVRRRCRASPVRRCRFDGSNNCLSDDDWLLFGGAITVGNVAGYISHRRKEMEMERKIERKAALLKIEREKALKKLERSLEEF